jgi:hypothetical protein
MSAIEVRPAIGPSAMFDAALAGSLAAGRCTAHAVLDRIESLTRLKASLPRLAPDRERDFGLAIDEARIAAARGVADEIVAAILALDFLSLELCDD